MVSEYSLGRFKVCIVVVVVLVVLLRVVVGVRRVFWSLGLFDWVFGEFLRCPRFAFLDERPTSYNHL
jgi:hypothetical protein